MEQNAETSVPMTPVVESKKKNGNGLKIATAIACVVAVCGIGFGVYGIMQTSQKDNQISDLKTKIEQLETSKNDDESTIVNTDNDANNSDKSFSTNILTNIKTLGDLVFGFKSYNDGNAVFYEYIDSNGDLILEKGKDKKYIVASNVIYADFLWESNNGVPSLYFVKNDGSVGAVKNITFVDTQDPEIKDVAISSKAVSVKNVSNPGGLHKIIVVDTDGNFVDL